MRTSPVLAMIREILPPGKRPTDPDVVAMLHAVPASMWNDYNLAETPESKSGAVAALRCWLQKFIVALI